MSSIGSKLRSASEIDRWYACALASQSPDLVLEHYRDVVAWLSELVDRGDCISDQSAFLSRSAWVVLIRAMDSLPEERASELKQLTSAALDSQQGSMARVVLDALGNYSKDEEFCFDALGRLLHCTDRLSDKSLMTYASESLRALLAINEERVISMRPAIALASYKEVLNEWASASKSELSRQRFANELQRVQHWIKGA